MIRTPYYLTLYTFSLIAALTLSGCGSSPSHQTTPRTTYGKTPLQAQPLQLSAGIAPAIARGDSGKTEPAAATIEPVVAQEPVVIEEPIIAEQPGVIEDPIVADEPEVIEEPVVAEQPEVVEEPVVAEQPEVVEEPVVAEQPEVVEEPVVAAQPIIEIDDESASDTAIAADFEEDSHISESLDPTHVNTLILMTGPGKLTIEHDPSAEKITFSADVLANGKVLGRATALSSGASIAIDQFALGRPRVRIVDPGNKNGIDYEVNLTVRMPVLEKEPFSLDIQDSSGDIAISEFNGELSITSLYGGIEISDCGGSLDVSSGKGPCNVSGFEGPVKVRDGSGNCFINQITGDVEIWGRGGSLEVRYISGAVTVIDARNGVTVQSIEGNLNLYAVPLNNSVIEGVSGSVVSKTGAP